MPFGNRLKEARLKKGYTQEELAKKLGISKGAIGNYESEVSSPKEEILIRLMKILEVDANFLFQDLVDVQPGLVLSQDESALLSGYRTLSREGKEYMLQTLALAQNAYAKNVSVSGVEDMA